MTVKEEVIYKLAGIVGFEIEKDFTRYETGGLVVDNDGDRSSGYIIRDTARNNIIVGGCDDGCEYTFSLEDVEGFIEDVFDNADMDYSERYDYVYEHLI